MKSYNKHPVWHNQPLRLSREQMQNPAPVIDDFFDTYHLNDVREILWNWMVEVVSTPRSISNDPRERNNHIFFYENIETLIEAAFVLRKKTTAQRHKQKNPNTKIKKNEKKNGKKQYRGGR